MLFLVLFVFKTFSGFQFIFSTEHWQIKYQQAVKDNKTQEGKLQQAKTENSELQLKYRRVQFLQRLH